MRTWCACSACRAHSEFCAVHDAMMLMPGNLPMLRACQKRWCLAWVQCIQTVTSS